MKKYKYEILPLLKPNEAGYGTMVNNFKTLGYKGYELITIENGSAFFRLLVDIPDRAEDPKEEVVKEVIAPEPVGEETPDCTNTGLRPVDEHQWILLLLKKHENSRAKVAEEMGISERQLYRKLSLYGLKRKYVKKVDHK